MCYTKVKLEGCVKWGATGVHPGYCSSQHFCIGAQNKTSGGDMENAGMF